MELFESPQEWLTTTEATALTGYAAAYLRRLAEQRRIKARKIGRDWLLDAESVQAYRRAMVALGPQRHSPWRKDLVASGKGRRAARRAQQEKE